jgi:hypothetical protein
MTRLMKVSAVGILIAGLFLAARSTPTAAAQQETANRPGAFSKLYELCAENTDPLAQVQACDAYLRHTK